RRWLRNLGVEKSWGTADSRSALTLATGGTFNRVEGLPVVLGPVFDWKLQQNVRLRLAALGAARTAGGVTDRRRDVGYLLRTALRPCAATRSARAPPPRWARDATPRSAARSRSTPATITPIPQRAGCCERSSTTRAART